MKKTILGAVAALLCSAVFAEMDLAGKTYNHGMFNYRLIDYAITIKPFEKVWFGIRDKMYTKGSYLPVSDSNVSYGALGTDGFTVLYMPVEGLKITAGLPSLRNYIYNFGLDTSYCIDKDGKYTYKTRPVVNSGVEYTYDESLCFAFIVNNLFFNKSHYEDGSDHKPFYRTTLGFYASFDANKWLDQNLTVNTGYTFKAGYTVNEKWLAECYLNINKNEEHFSAGEMYYSINPCATYTYNEHHKFRAGLNYNFFTDRWNNTEQKYEDGINNFYVNFGWTYTL